MAVQRFFESTRSSLHRSGTAVTKHIGHRVPDNHVSQEFIELTLAEKKKRFENEELDLPGRGLRRDQAKSEKILFDKPLSTDFVLVIKHPAMFTALLGGLVNRFRCFAAMRNPLAILSSWNSFRFNIQFGRVPAAENFDRGLKIKLENTQSRIDRQLIILSWFFEQYSKYLSPEQILRYESLIESGARSLSVMQPMADGLAKSLEGKNLYNVYDKNLSTAVAKRLLDSDRSYWKYYSKESVERLLFAWRRNF